MDGLREFARSLGSEAGRSSAAGFRDCDICFPGGGYLAASKGYQTSEKTLNDGDVAGWNIVANVGGGLLTVRSDVSPNCWP